MRRARPPFASITWIRFNGSSLLQQRTLSLCRRIAMRELVGSPKVIPAYTAAMERQAGAHRRLNTRSPTSKNLVTVRADAE